MVEWMQVDGPLDAFPPASYKNLFGDVPLKARSVVKAEHGGHARAGDQRKAA